MLPATLRHLSISKLSAASTGRAEELVFLNYSRDANAGCWQGRLHFALRVR